MANEICVEQLTPLDLLMPKTYIGILLTFSSAATPSTITQLQTGLDRLVQHIPWLSGKVFPTTAGPDGKPSLEIRWNGKDDTLKIVDKGLIPASYNTLRKEGMPAVAFPPRVWPTPGLIDNTLFEKGAPVLGVSFVRFDGDQGVGLLICGHHNAMDATGLTEVIRLWTQNVSGAPSKAVTVKSRLRLADTLSHDIESLAAVPREELFDLHPEYSKTSSPWPAEFPPCASKLFCVPIARIESIKELLKISMPKAPSTNTIICALIWSAMTHARTQQNSSVLSATSRLAMAVNGRRRIGPEFAVSGSLYLGNVVLCSVAELPVSDLSEPAMPDSVRSLGKLCQVIAQSQSPELINSRHIAEVYEMVNHLDDYRDIFYGFDLFNERDLMITSWAEMDINGLDFGIGIGKPDFMRVPHVAADGMAVILPRKRIANEVLEVVVMLKNTDMETLESSDLWKSIMI